MEKTIISTSAAPKAVGPYSQGVKISGAGEFFYFSGALGIDPVTSKIEGDLKAQTQQALKNIGELLKAANLTPDNIIKSLIFLVDMDDFPIVNAEYAAFFSGDFPARSCVQVCKLPLGGLVEIEVIAAR
ncbi:MAG: Rid family detoxifying hydrolase [Firmicutes bacterium]|nr:Rid family detoxifying hydrolase [Bacillota bacterium]